MMLKTDSGIPEKTVQPQFLCLLSTGSSYYDNVRPLAYPDSDAVLICFDISRPETLDSVIKKVSFGAAAFKLGVFCPDRHLLLTGKSALGSLHFHGPVTE